MYDVFLRFPDYKTKAVTFSYDDGVEQDEKLIHIFNQNGQMKFSASRHFKTVCIFHFFHSKTYVCVQLFKQAVTQMAGSYIFSFLSGKRTVIYNEIHRDCWFRNLLERNWCRIFR